jgi:predicted nicotinamide N-methyase
MSLISLTLGIVLLWAGGYDLARYIDDGGRRSLIYCVVTTVLGVVNILLGAGVGR